MTTTVETDVQLEVLDDRDIRALVERIATETYGKRLTFNDVLGLYKSGQLGDVAGRAHLISLVELAI